MCLGIGLLCGLANGVMVVGLKVHPFIITLGTMWVFRGIAFVTSKAESILVPDALTSVVKTTFGSDSALYPVPMLVMILVTALGAIYLSRTVMGRHIYAVGGNVEASRYSGLRLGRILIGVYALSGLTAGIAAYMGISYYGSATCGDATGYELYVIASAVVGGASLTRRQGQRDQRHAGRDPHRADPAGDPPIAFRPELRMDHHRLRDRRRGGAGPVQRAIDGDRRLSRKDRNREEPVMNRLGKVLMSHWAAWAVSGGCQQRPRRRRRPSRSAMIAKSSTNPVFLSARTGAEAAAKELSAKYDIDIVIDWRTPPDRGRPGAGAAHRRRPSTKATTRSSCPVPTRQGQRRDQ